MKLSNEDLISFERLDYSISSHIEEISKELADHFKVRRPYVSEFCSLVKTSKRWDTNNVTVKLDRWKIQMEKFNGSKKIIDIVKRAFESCTTNDEISSLRGAMVEALVIGCFGGEINLSKTNYGWGARVDINVIGEPVREVVYKCKIKKEPDCKNRSTVDFGYWDGLHGKFFECKVQPVSIGCKEVSYMKHLKEELEEHKVSHEIFFVCAEHSDEIKIKLEMYGLSPLYKAVGVQELVSMMKAS